MNYTTRASIISMNHSLTMLASNRPTPVRILLSWTLFFLGRWDPGGFLEKFPIYGSSWFGMGGISLSFWNKVSAKGRRSFVDLNLVIAGGPCKI